MPIRTYSGYEHVFKGTRPKNFETKIRKLQTLYMPYILAPCTIDTGQGVVLTTF
jgi:hypothetical protein